MKRLTLSILRSHCTNFIFLLMAFAGTASGQTIFDSGSNGSYGPMNITANTTLQVPPDGIFHCTTITVGAGKNLTFTNNERNTPVYLLAQGEINVEGIIRLNGTGSSSTRGGNPGPGGWGGGNPVMTGFTRRGAGFGPGGALHQELSTYNYGNPLLIPLIGGSGTDSGGGGAILLASNISINITGAIEARGGGAAVGGAIRIVSPRVSGSGSLWVNTGYNSNTGWYNGGRIRVDCTNRSFWNPWVTPNSKYSTGFNMIVFPPNLPKVEIIQVAGQAIDPNSASPVNQVFAEGTNPQQTIRCRVSNFNGTAKLQVRLTPENGDYINYNLDIPNPGPDPAEGEVTVTFPVNLMTRVDAWTRGQ